MALLNVKYFWVVPELWPPTNVTWKSSPCIASVHFHICRLILSPRWRLVCVISRLALPIHSRGTSLTLFKGVFFIAFIWVRSSSSLSRRIRHFFLPGGTSQFYHLDYCSSYSLKASHCNYLGPRTTGLYSKVFMFNTRRSSHKGLHFSLHTVVVTLETSQNILSIKIKSTPALLLWPLINKSPPSNHQNKERCSLKRPILCLMSEATPLKSIKWGFTSNHKIRWIRWNHGRRRTTSSKRDRCCAMLAPAASTGLSHPVDSNALTLLINSMWKEPWRRA